MTEPQLTKVQNELIALQEELEAVSKAVPMSEACTKIVEFTNNEEDPFSLGGSNGPNPFAVEKSGPCACSIM